MTQELIFYPSIAMFALTALMLARMGVQRYRAVAAGAVDPRYYRLYTGAEEPPELRKLARHVQNHFEVPPLFHLVVLMIYVTGQVSTLSLVLAWLFVILRGLHSAMHLGRNVVTRRFASFIASSAVLAGLWAVFAVGLLQR